MFRGSSFHTIDDKGRIIIPTRFRNVIDDSGDTSVMISRMDNCLVAYTLEEWYKIEKKILSLARSSESMRRFRRVFIGGAHECSRDKQERILVPPMLRQYAQLEKNIVLVGVLDHFEIWSKYNYEQETLALVKDLEDADFKNEIAGLVL